MTQTYTIAFTPQLVDADDAAGHALQPGTFKVQASGRLFDIAPLAALRLTLPDPAPVIVKGMDVKGFIGEVAPVAEGQESDDVQGHIWPLLGVIAGGFLIGYGGVSFYRDHIETTEVPKNPPKGGNYNP